MVGRRRGCRFFLGTLVLFLVLFPVLEDLTRPILLTVAIATVFVGGVVVVQPGRLHVRRAATLAVVQSVLTVLAVMLKTNSPSYQVTIGIALVTCTVLIVYCIYCVLRYVLYANYISRDQIYAGISVYLMFGFAFGCIYYLTDMLYPNSFAVNTAKLDASGEPDLMYFSFVTLATLGYGDITPVARFARALAQLEALAGSLYMAVFMARLVSMAGGAVTNITSAGDSQSLSGTTHRQ